MDCDGRVDMYDFYGLQTCFGAVTQPCLALFDYDASGTVDWPDAGQFGQTAGSPAMAAWQRRIVPSRYGNPFMWTGQRFDAATGQYHFWARTYSPHLGRWLQRDPLGYVDGVSLNEYVASKPTGFTDPLGLHYVPYVGPIVDDAGGNSGTIYIPTPNGWMTVHYKNISPQIVYKHVLLLLRLFKELGLSLKNIPMTFYVDSFFIFSNEFGKTSKLTGAVTVNKDLVMSLLFVDADSLIELLAQNNIVIELFATLIHEHAHARKGRAGRIAWSFLQGFWRDSPEGFRAELLGLNSLLLWLEGLLNDSSLDPVIRAKIIHLIDQVKAKIDTAKKKLDECKPIAVIA